MTQKNKTPLLKGFTIKAYTGSVPSDSEASLRRAAGEKDTGTEVTDPPYFPPTPPNPTDPDAGGGSGGGSNPGNPGGGGGGSTPGNPGGGTDPSNPGGGDNGTPGTPGSGEEPDDDPSDGVSAGGKVTIRILERKDSPDKYCLGIDYPIKVTAKAHGDSRLIKVVLKFKIGKKGSAARTEIPFKEYNYAGSTEEAITDNITLAQLTEWGVVKDTYLQLVATAYSQDGESATTTDFVYFVDCNEEDDPNKDSDGDGIPDKDDPNPNQPDELKVTITPKTTELCYGDDLMVSGVVDGPYPITKVVMLVNGSAIDESTSGGGTAPTNPTPTNPTTPPATSNGISYFVDGSVSPSSINQDYWTGNKAFSGNVQITNGYIYPLTIEPNFFKGRNEWLDFMEAVRQKLAPGEDAIYSKSDLTIQSFHAFLWKMHQDNLKGLVTLPQPWSSFKSWAQTNLPGLTTLQLGSIYATYKIKNICFFFSSASAYLDGDIIDTLSDLVAKTNTYTYHWIDFNDIKTNPSVAAWAKDGELPQFYSYINFEPDALNASVINLMAHRPTDYTSNPSTDQSDTLTPLDVYKSYWLPIGSLGNADLYTLDQNQVVCRPYIAGEVAIHEIGHAVAFYGADYYTSNAGHKYASDIGLNLHDYKEWQEISGWDAINWSGMSQYYKLKKSSAGTKLDNGKEAPVTAYGCTQPAEGFAEAYRLYIINPGFLRANFPQQFAFMEKYVKNLKSIGPVSTASIESTGETIVIDGYHSPFWMATSPYEQTFNFRYPTLDWEVGDSFVVEVKAYDSEGNEASDSMTVTIKDCSIDPNGPTVRDCLMFDTLHVEYYDANIQDIKKFDIPADWLPYEIDNGDGATAMFGWGDDNTIAAWFRDGGNNTGYGFQLSSIGINYLDEHNNAKTAWANSIFFQSEGVKNSERMIGDPAEKDNSRWIQQIKAYGNYSMSPSLGYKGDYVKFSFPNEFTTNQCPINKDVIDPENAGPNTDDPTSPDVPPYDPTKNPVRDCLLLDKIIFQYYSDVDNQMQTNIVPLEWLVTQELTVPTKAGDVRLVAGWSDYYKGVSLLIRGATGVNNIQLTGIGVIFKDYYDRTQTAWATDINFKTAGVKRKEWMIGGPKTMSNLPWVAEVQAGDYSNAPIIGKTGDFVVSKHVDLFTNMVCSIDPIHNSDPETGAGRDPKLEITEPSSNPTVIEQCNTDSLTIGGFAEMFPSVANIKATYRGSQVYSQDGDEVHEDFRFTIPSSAFGTGGGTTTDNGRADITFLIDYSGSMSAPIGKVADNLAVFISRLQADNVNYRLGCIQYSEVNDGQPIVKIGQTDNADNFISMLRSIAVSGGGDTNESGLESIMDPTNGALTYGFRTGAARHYILLTDAPVHDKDGDGRSVYGVTQTINKLKENNIKLHVIGPMSGEPYNQLKPMADATGGQYVDIMGNYGSQLQGISGQISEDAGELNSGKVIITATGADGRTLTREIQINVHDCSVPAPAPSPDEGNIENSYDMLFRLRWGVAPGTEASDFDFHAFLDRDSSKHLFYNSPPDAQYPNYKSYVEGTNKLYLNYDYTAHRAGQDDPWSNQVEIITVDGFVGRVLTLVVNHYQGAKAEQLDRLPQVEIVNAATNSVLQVIPLAAEDFSGGSVAVCDILLKSAGQTKLSDITIRKEKHNSIYP